MTISYEDFADAFLQKITEFELLQLLEADREAVVDSFMKRAVSVFRRVCAYDMAFDDAERAYTDDYAEEDVDEIIDIVSEGMVVQWLKPYVYKQELLENALTTRDYSTYAPAELLRRVGEAYKEAQNDYIQMVREYSYNHGDLTELHI